MPSSIRHQLRLSICFALLSLRLSPLHPVAAKAQKEVQLADHAFTAAIINSDRGMVSQSLDPDFTWTDRTGKTRPKSEVVSSLALLARDADTDVQIWDAGKAVLIRGSHHVPEQNASVRFVRIWVK